MISISVSLIFACKFQSLIGVKINWNAVGLIHESTLQTFNL
ncbi:hypothetical protein C789_4356 [Microcystis aeruginosa FACHB-905 = DIANCHI905]|nr:hypothetical protein C789_4356 [Microcystis aeruginosa FACHB-905 = DIANCHI905]